MNLFLDFDGTLVDISEKYWWVYSGFMQSRGGALPARELFWQTKRDGGSDATLLSSAGLDPRLAPELKAHIQGNIETNAALSRDTVFPGTESLLESLGRSHTLILISARKNPSNLRDQITSLGLDRYFAEILTAAGENESLPGGHTAKSVVLSGSRWIKPGAEALIAGDAAMDVLTGKALGIRTCAVLSGIRTRRFLEKLQPDHIVDSIHHLPAILRPTQGSGQK